MVNCAVSGCNNYHRITKGSRIKYFSFPKNKDFARQWEIACRRGDKINLKNATICSNHFDANSFEIPLKFRLLNYMPKCARLLREDALPTLKLPGKLGKSQRSQRMVKKIHSQEINNILIEEKDGGNNSTSSRMLNKSNFNLTSECSSTSIGNETLLNSEKFDELKEIVAMCIMGNTINLVCRQCCFKTQWKFAIEEHTKQHSKIGLNNSFNCSAALDKHKCVQCNFKSTTLEKLQQHKILQHLHSTTPLDKNNSNTSKSSRKNCKSLNYNNFSNRNLNGNWLNCSDYDYKAKFKSHLEIHKFRRHVPSEKIQWFQCSDCDFKTKTKENLEYHYVLHIPDEQINWFNCSDCEYKGKTKKALKIHTIVCHTPDDQISWFKCDDCDYKSKTKPNLTKHKHWCHTPDEQIVWFKCSDCDYTAKSKFNIKIHQRTRHTPDEQINWFKCNECDFKTKTGKALKHHKVMHHTDDDEVNWFQCSDCNYKTKIRCNLKIHKIVRHTSDNQINWFECGDCDYRTQVRGNLKKHRHRRHSK